MNSNIGRLPHEITAIEPTNQLPAFADDEYCWTDAVDSNYLPVPCDCKSRHNIDVSYGNFLEKMAVFREILHTRTLVSAIAYHVLSSSTHYGNLPRIPQLSFVLARGAKLELEGSRLIENLQRETIVLTRELEC